MSRPIEDRQETATEPAEAHDTAIRDDESTLVSVVIPTCNRTDLLKRAVDSALGQTYKSIEVIVVVDGADPATESYLETLNDHRVRYIVVVPQVGGSEARNIGVRSGSGRWVAFLDDDDAWLPTKLEKQLALANARGGRDTVISCKIIGRYPRQDHIWPRRLPAAKEPICEYLFNRRSWFRGEGQIITSSFLASRDLMLDIPFTAGLPKHQDTDWYIRVAAKPSVDFLFVDEPLVIWYLDITRSSVVRHYDWHRSWNWLLSVRGIITERSFAGFIATQLAGEAAAQGAAWGAASFLLRQMFICGRPGAMDIILFFCNCILTPSLRSRLRSALSGSRVAQRLSVEK